MVSKLALVNSYCWALLDRGKPTFSLLSARFVDLQLIFLELQSDEGMEISQKQAVMRIKLAMPSIIFLFNFFCTIFYSISPYESNRKSQNYL